jgi:hypothetical protein
MPKAEMTRELADAAGETPAALLQTGGATAAGAENTVERLNS